jgi:hypothetical protein
VALGAVAIHLAAVLHQELCKLELLVAAEQ